MHPFLKINKWRVAFFVVLGIAILISFQYALTPEKTLKVLSPLDFDPTLVDDSKLFVKKYHHIGPFSLVNQHGDTITEQDYLGKIYVADFFFTTCPTICPVMTKNMTRLQEEFKNDPEIMLLSHSVTPEYDTPAILNEYAKNMGITSKRWNLVTGPRKEIYDLARKSYLAVKEGFDKEDYSMVHTENFMLVDKKGQLRSRSYDGTDPEEIEALIEDIYILKANYKK